MKILFLHGLDARPGGIKPTYLTQQGHAVFNPALPREEFDQSVQIAQKALAENAPDVVVGSSRGGAVALAMELGDVPLVVLAPAWRFFHLSPIIPKVLRILHSPMDHLIPIEHSRLLLELADGRDAELIEIGKDHSLTDAESLAAMDRAVRDVAAKHRGY